jgi:hypothetical protein
MMWTLLTLCIIIIFIAGMILAAKLADKYSGGSQVARGNCRRGAINYAGRKDL